MVHSLPDLLLQIVKLPHVFAPYAKTAAARAEFKPLGALLQQAHNANLIQASFHYSNAQNYRGGLNFVKIIKITEKGKRFLSEPPYSVTEVSLTPLFSPNA